MDIGFACGSGVGISCVTGFVVEKKRVYSEFLYIVNGFCFSCSVCSCSDTCCFFLCQSICRIMCCTSCGCSVLLRMLHVHCCVPALYVMLLWRHVVFSFGTPVCIVRVLFCLHCRPGSLVHGVCFFAASIEQVCFHLYGVWVPVVAIFAWACLVVLVFSGHVFRIRVLGVDVLSFLCVLGKVFHTSCTRVPGLVFLLCVLACVCLLCTSASCLPMHRVLAVLFRAFVGHVGIFLVVLAVFYHG